MLCVVLIGGLLCFGQDFFGWFPLVTKCGVGHPDCEERRLKSQMALMREIVIPERESVTFDRNA